jgi:hypothetical protein
LIRKGKIVMNDMEIKEQGSIVELKKLGLRLRGGPQGSLLAQLKIRFVPRGKVLVAQQVDKKRKKKVRDIKESVNQGIEKAFQMLSGGLIAMGRRIYLPDHKTLKEEVLRETHESHFATHLGSTKMYKDLKKYYWWPNMKREIAEFVLNCGICQ